MQKLGDNIRIRMSSEKYFKSPEKQQLLMDNDPPARSPKTKRWTLGVIAICAVVGIAIVATIFVVRSQKSDGTNDLQLSSQQLNIDVDRERIANDHNYRLQIVNEILDKVPLIDGHNDLAMVLRGLVDTKLSDVDLRSHLPSHTDIPRLRKGKVGGQFWSIYAGCSSQYKDAVQRGIEQIDLVKSMIIRYPDVFTLVTSAKDIREVHSTGKVASMLGMESGHMIGESMAVLRQIYELGVRYLTLTHNCNTPWGDSCCDSGKKTPDNNGLSGWGKLLVKEMNRLGMLVDLSHVSPEVMHDALNASSAPVIFSHSSAKALCPHPRNVPDDILSKMKQNGGIVMINFNPGFVNCSKENLNNNIASLEQVADHVDYVQKLAGEDHVGIGGDYDGILSVPVGLEDVSKYPDLLAELLRRGWSVNQLAKLAGDNLIRTFHEVEKVKSSLKSQLPEEAPIDPSKIPDTQCSSDSIKYP